MPKCTICQTGNLRNAAVRMTPRGWVCRDRVACARDAARRRMGLDSWYPKQRLTAEVAI